MEGEKKNGNFFPGGGGLGGHDRVDNGQIKAELQVIILDCSNTLWLERDNQVYETQTNGTIKSHSSASSSSLLSFENLIRSLLLFCNAHCAMSRDNMLCLLAHNETTCDTIFPSPDLVRQHSERAFIPILTSFCDEITERLISFSKLISSLSDEESKDMESSSNGSLAKCLSSALCIINRRLQSNPQLSAKILIIQISPDLPQTYNHIMNCIFSAQKIGVLVDSLVLSSSQDSSFLQQASFLTNGVYIHSKDQNSTLQSLFYHILPSAQTRQNYLLSPLQRSVDFKASCSCHGQQVEFTYMCSVCLSLYCRVPDTQCDTCGTLIRKK